MSYLSIDKSKAIKKNRVNDSFFIGYDWVLITSALLLSVIGAALVYSASNQRLQDAGLPTDFYLQRHIFDLILGLILGLIVSRFS
ncbi:MAG: hypothetical protein EBV27_04800, partial [Actinobacteria bacterium]|nr:hypothetical protein [Actinomycetota bacterium]